METNLLPIKEQIDILLNGDAHDLPLDSCQSLDLEFSLPPWFDKEKYKRGQEYIKRNIFAQFQVTLYGLVVVLSVPSILNILMGTKKSATLKTAYRRYLSTIMHVYSWYNDDLKPGTKAWKSLIAVRSRHLRASKTSQRKGSSHISQRDLVLTQFGFYGLGLIKPSMIGMRNGSVEDVEGYVHFWRTIGYMMGIDDRLNLCRPNVKEAIEVTETICKEAYIPLLHSPPEYFLYMTMELLKAILYLIPVMTTKAFFYFVFVIIGVPTFYTDIERKNNNNNKTIEDKYQYKTNKLITEVKMVKNNQKIIENIPINGNDIYSTFNWFDRFCLYMLFNVPRNVATYTLARLYFNGQIKMIMFFVTYFPFLCFYKFGFRNSYVDMFAEDKIMDFKPKTNLEMLGYFGACKTEKIVNNNNDIVKAKCVS